MVYKGKKDWRDFVEFEHHHGLTRRELLKRGLWTGSISLGVSQMLMGDLIKRAYAAGEVTTCPLPTRAKGCIAQLLPTGGPTMGARFLGEDQAAAMNSGMANNYGITGTNLEKLGPNLVIDKTSPFGATLLQGPDGFPGGPQAWKEKVLSRISGAGHRGPFNADDNGGTTQGLLGGVSPFKISEMGKDLRLGTSSAALAKWAQGLPAANINKSNLSPTSFTSAFSMTPPAKGLVDEVILAEASNASTELGMALSSIFKTLTRKGSKELSLAVNCGIKGNSALANPTFAAKLFDLSQFVDDADKVLTSNLDVTKLTPAEKSHLAAYFRSAQGIAGGIISQFNGRDYHGADPQTQIAPDDIEEARAIVMFLAACYSAQARGALIYVSDGQAIARGIKPVTATIGASSVSLNAPVAVGDAGGTYNAGLMILFEPGGEKAPPQGKMTGSIDKNGVAKSDPNVIAGQEAMAGLYLTALSFIHDGKIPAEALTAMQKEGFAKNPSKIILI